MTKFGPKNFLVYFSPKFGHFYIEFCTENTPKNFLVRILSFMVRIHSLGPTFGVFVIFGFWSILGAPLQGVKFWKPWKNFVVFRAEYLGRKLLTSKTFFFRKSASTNSGRLFPSAKANSAILMSYLDFRGQGLKIGVFEKPENHICGFISKNFKKTMSKIFLQKTYGNSSYRAESPRLKSLLVFEIS